MCDIGRVVCVLKLIVFDIFGLFWVCKLVVVGEFFFVCVYRCYNIVVKIEFYDICVGWVEIDV